MNFSELNIADLGMCEVTTGTLVLLIFEELILGMFSQLQPILLSLWCCQSLCLYRYVILDLSEVQTATHKVGLTPVH